MAFDRCSDRPVQGRENRTRSMSIAQLILQLMVPPS